MKSVDIYEDKFAERRRMAIVPKKKKKEEDEEGKVVEIERSFRRSYQIEILSIQPCRPSTT